ncbi:MAG: HEPN domain-containing protein [Nitrospirae bacterium]|nr:HEPN domain-containing protein [Nitrospirota bacterium]MBI4838029.1 HEPN domain-containing protein [Nitrospirota bacterium]MBI5195536.1 HEPN domain-containing protein [Nitrospirota bacterium]
MNINKKVNEIAREWIGHAEEDLRLAKHAFKLSSSCPYKLVAFHAQQCAEKYLKAFLTIKNVDFPYTHNISLLLELCSSYADWAKDLHEAEDLTPYAITARYPGKDKVTKKDAVKAVETANKVRKIIRKVLKQHSIKP